MRSIPSLATIAVAAVLAVALAGLLATSQASADSTVNVVMSGLDNPRGLAFGPEGALYVAEAGRGDLGEGDGPCTVVGGATFCYGPTGAVSRLWDGTQERIATGLPSVAGANGVAQAGPTDISFLGRGGAFVTIGLRADPAVRSELGDAGAGLGQLLHVAASGEWRYIADVAAYEAEVNPGSGPIDSNPYGVLAEPGGRVVADAGGNSLLLVGAEGAISTLATFPSRAQGRATDSVPTAVVVGPDGAYYVAELTGVPFSEGAANIYRLLPGEEPQIVLSGFKTIIDIAFDSDGNLYVLQHATGPTGLQGPGVLIRVAADGTRTLVLDDLDRPTAVAVGPDGALYVSNHGLSVGGGEVLRVEPN
jgi:hypothetical protein